MKYKLKNLMYRKKRPILKSFIGRSKIATIKKRFKGRFVKSLKVKKKKIFKLIGNTNSTSILIFYD